MLTKYINLLLKSYKSKENRTYSYFSWNLRNQFILNIAWIKFDTYPNTAQLIIRVKGIV